jgi:hypothetical protein
MLPALEPPMNIQARPYRQSRHNLDIYAILLATSARRSPIPVILSMLLDHITWRLMPIK